MNPHVIELLAAYHDGELTSHRRHQVENHLQDCAACRAELDALEGLSSFLKSDLAPHQTTPERFAAQVQLRLPHAVPSRILQKAGEPPKWLLGIPFVLITVWAFMQAAVWVTAFVIRADQFLGTVGRPVAFLGSWLTTEGFLETSVNLLLFNAILLIATAILWSAWMALWLAWNNNQNELTIKGGVR
jgi:anti-sigma factor RsiW